MSRDYLRDPEKFYEGANALFVVSNGGEDDPNGRPGSAWPGP
jgi:hypothetical protein